MTNLMQQFEEQIKKTSDKVFRSTLIIEKETEILNNLKIINSYFLNKLSRFKSFFPNCSINYKEKSVTFLYNEQNHDFYSEWQFSFEFSFSVYRDNLFKNNNTTYLNQEQYLLIKEVEQLFLTIEEENVRLYFHTLKLIDKHIELTNSILKNDYKQRTNIIENFFIKPHPEKEEMKANIKSNFCCLLLRFDKANNLAIISDYNYSYNIHEKQLEINNQRITYKSGKEYIDQNIVFNDILLTDKYLVQQYLPIFKYNKVQGYFNDKLACDIDLLLEFINASEF